MILNITVGLSIGIWWHKPSKLQQIQCWLSVEGIPHKWYIIWPGDTVYFWIWKQTGCQKYFQA